MAARASGDLKTANEMQAFSKGAGVAGYRLDRIHHFSVTSASSLLYLTFDVH